jgi:hypothetical protein
MPKHSSHFPRPPNRGSRHSFRRSTASPPHSRAFPSGRPAPLRLPGRHDARNAARHVGRSVTPRRLDSRRHSSLCRHLRNHPHAHTLHPSGSLPPPRANLHRYPCLPTSSRADPPRLRPFQIAQEDPRRAAHPRMHNRSNSCRRINSPAVTPRRRSARPTHRRSTLHKSCGSPNARGSLPGLWRQQTNHPAPFSRGNPHDLQPLASATPPPARPTVARLRRKSNRRRSGFRISQRQLLHRHLPQTTRRHPRSLPELNFYGQVSRSPSFLISDRHYLFSSY